METEPHRTPVALFVALTRAVREAPVSEGARLRAYEAVEGMARTLGQPRFKIELEAFVAAANCDARFFATLQPLWPELRGLSASIPDLLAGTPKAR